MSGSLSRQRLAAVVVALFATLAIALIVPIRSHAADRVYWASFEKGTIQWANLDGSGGIHELNPGAATISPMGYAAGGAIDPDQGRYYWVNQIDKKINWANLDNSGGGDLNIGTAEITSSSYGLSVDPVGRRVYWGSDGTIEYANLDGSGGGTLDIGSASVNSAVATTIDPATRTIYWGNGGSKSGSIYFAKLDGSGGAQLKLTGTGPIEYPFGIAIDAAAKRIYWANDTGPGTIASANLDGTDSVEVPRRGLELNGPYGIALDPEAGRVYTAIFADDVLPFLNTNGSGGATVPVSMPENSGPNFPVLYKEPKVTAALTLRSTPPPTPRYKKTNRRKHPPSPLPKLVGSSLGCIGGSFAPDLVEAHLYRAPVSVDHVVTRDGAAVSSFQTGLGPQPEVLRGPPTATVPGNYRCQVVGTNTAGTTAATSAPVAIFATGKTRLNKKKGTALLTVLLPAEKGNLTLAAKGFKPVSKEASGTVLLPVKPKGAKKAKLASKGSLNTVLKLTYTPPGGAPAGLRTRITLKQR